VHILVNNAGINYIKRCFTDDGVGGIAQVGGGWRGRGSWQARGHLQGQQQR